MPTLRTMVVGATAAALLVTPATATALAPTDSAGAKVTTAAKVSTQVAPAAAASRYNTWVRFLRFDHSRPWSRRVHIKGQIAAWVDGEKGALRGVRVRLLRQLDGRKRWVELARTTTTRTDRPKFRFHVRAKANADYRVVFRGNERFQPTRGKTHVSVHRIFNARLRDGTGRFRGRVQPSYGNRVIYLEKRSCASCGWHKVRSKKTGDRGYWRFKVGAPNNGRWWWRASVPGSTLYIRSISGVFTTELN